ncbi:MAG: hypothetical protein ACLTSS_06000 [Phocaeicola coprocola]
MTSPDASKTHQPDRKRSMAYHEHPDGRHGQERQMYFTLTEKGGNCLEEIKNK